MQILLAALLGAIITFPSLSRDKVASATPGSPRALASFRTLRHKALGADSPRTGYPRRGTDGVLHPLELHQENGGANNSYAVTMRLDAGWNGRYRAGPAWTPVRVTMRNSTSQAITGTLELPDTSIADAVQSGQTRAALYSEIMTLPAGGTKQVTLYVPAADINNVIAVVFRAGHRTFTSGSAFPSAYSNQDVLVGALTGDPAALSWLNRIRAARSHFQVVPLDPATVDALPEVLASFDLIVVTNIDSSRLDRDQLIALDRYVRNGGSLLLVGGPDATEALRPLRTSLLPGNLAGSLPLPNLSRLSLLGQGLPPSRPTTVSILHVSHGAVLAAEKGVPLVVRTGLGNGSLEYLAFDPALEPLASWNGAPALLERLVLGAAPQAMRRMSLPPGYGEVSFLKPGNGALDISREAVSLPVVPSSMIVLLVSLALLYVFLAGPLSFLAARRWRRPGLVWLTVPVLALTFTGLSGLIGARAQSDRTIVNSLGTLQLDGKAGKYPLDLYLGLTAPATGGYRLSYEAPGLASPVIPFSSPQPQPQSADQAVDWKFFQGAPASIAFTANGDLRTRAASLRTVVPISGGLKERLRLNQSGDIVGTIENDTGLTLVEPAIIAGRAWQRLPKVEPHQSVQVRLRPYSDVRRHDYSEMLYKVYGRSSVFDTGSDLWRESSLADRIRDAVSALPQTHVLSMLGEVTFVAWSDQPLIDLRLNGSAPARRSLTLVAKPLTIELAPGITRLRTGTLGASFVEETPAQPRYACCNPSAQAVYLGAGGSATFEFDVPGAKQVRFRNLTLSVYGGGPDSTYTGYTDMPAGACLAFDWQQLRWQTLKFRNGEAALSRPARFVSATGALLVKLRALDESHELIITDPHQDLQLSGTLVVS